jgi:hypothetical protein
VPAKAGRRFECHFTGPDGKYVAYMLITSVKGTRVNFRIQTERVGHTIDPAQAEQIITTFVAKHTGVHPRNVTCPSGVIPLVGHTLVCHFTAPDGSYVATLTITSANMGTIDYRIQTKRTS